MVVFLLILILLAALGVLGLALKIALALFLGITIAAVTFAVVGYYVVRHQFRKAQQSLNASMGAGAPRPRAATSAGTTVEIGQPTRSTPEIDDSY